ncbi:hypothetical protein ACIBHX_06355 [Nonomuraea sp. NPDC050536]|uniref:hypothetical protein n=1 Tax=Nonomuraea sp. NPDC050536 TaxID=3364366 RepID=UPI0037C8C6C3
MIQAVLAAALLFPTAQPHLPDLTQDVKGKIVAHHVDDKAKLTGWRTTVKVSRFYELWYTCLSGPGITVKVSDGSTLREKCDGEPHGVGADKLSKRKHPYTFRVSVQPGTRWAIVVSTAKR